MDVKSKAGWIEELTRAEVGSELEGNCGKHGHTLGQVLSKQDTPVRRAQPHSLQFAISGLVQMMFPRMGVLSGAVASGKYIPCPCTPQPQESNPQESGKQPRFSHCVKIPRAEVVKLNLPSPKVMGSAHIGSEESSCETKDWNATHSISTQHLKCARPNQKPLITASTRESWACLKIQSTGASTKVTKMLEISDKDFIVAIIRKCSDEQLWMCLKQMEM